MVAVAMMGDSMARRFRISSAEHLGHDVIVLAEGAVQR
jgi:hypothetical protein